MQGNMANIMDTVGKFPCGLSKVALTPEGGLAIWPDFLQNEYFKIVSYKPDSPMKYKTKLQQKYPEYIHE